MALTLTKLSDLPPGGPLDGTEKVPAVQGGETVLVPLTSTQMPDFIGTGTGAQPRSILNKLSDQPVSLLDYYNAATDNGDYYNAFTRALAVSQHIYIPPGTYDVNTPVTYSTPITIEGASFYATAGDASTTINAPNGFLVNSDTTRKRMILKNMLIQGTGTGIGIDGPFGGFIEGVRISSYDQLIRNASAYLLHLYRCAFYGAASIAVNVADFNGSSIHECHFENTNKCHISVLDVTPQSGSNNGAPYIISNNNFNFGDNFAGGMTGVKLRGLFSFRDNYMEDFTPNPSGNTFVYIQAYRWDDMSFDVSNNLLNGQGAAQYGIVIAGNDTTGNGYNCECPGTIWNNRIQGFVADCGITFDNTNGHATGVRIVNNTFGSGGKPIGGYDGKNIYRPLAHGRWSDATVSIAGSTLVKLPIGQTVVVDNATGFTDAYTYTCQRSGVYRFQAVIIVRSTSADYPSVGGGLFQNNFEAEYMNASLKFISSPTHQTMAIDVMINASINDKITVQAHNGELAPNGSFSAEYLGDGWS